MLTIRSVEQPEELWRIFEEELKDHLLVLKTFMKKSSLDVGDRKKLSHRLHRLKGSLGFIGFLDLHKKISGSESLLKQEDNLFVTQTTPILNELEILQNEITEKLQQC